MAVDERRQLVRSEVVTATILLLGALTIASELRGQSRTGSQSSATVRDRSALDAFAQHSDKIAPRLERRVRPSNERSAEGGELTAYLDAGKVVKVVLVLYGETGRATESLYRLPGGLSLLVIAAETYNKSTGALADDLARGQSGGLAVDSSYERRVYLRDDSVFAWSETGVTVAGASEARVGELQREAQGELGAIEAGLKELLTSH